MFVIAGVLIAAAIAALVATTLIKDIRLALAEWLRSRGLQASALMNVLVRLDRVDSGVRASLKIRVRRRRKATVVLEQIYSMAQVKDASLRAELDQRGYIKYQILDLLDLV